ncbi:CPBP family intramembrane glutamic endopeptidase [Halogeometricum luteum]|uniref:CPBP family glutamic-type intramembrane protease n=1 Tax=Halogeometricum luteum TaxID=2950537 RepID=A0ABU2G5B7_9EURY|nr:CPBP family intramembrane glutamic endopeptidase [Halogeometricum sp. S3BR5-2]MDS0295991.1 CPBP family glutamic-type intramembrane protease [Halogeometricum sp. S3BR5-2]
MDLTPVTAVGLVVALVGFESLHRLRERFGWTGGTLSDHVWKWVVPAIILLVVAAEGKTPASIGWHVESVPVLVWQVGVGLAAMLGTNLLLAPLWARVGDGGESLAEGIGSFAALSVPERLFVAATAGVTEEIPYHGYAVERLAALTGSVPFAGVVAFVAFTLGHLGDTWDRQAVLRIAQPALVTTLLYLWFRSLPVLIAVHALNDAIGLLVADRYAPDPDEEDEETPAVVRWLE